MMARRSSLVLLLPLTLIYSDARETWSWGPRCRGNWTQWSECRRDCCRARTFVSSESEECPAEAVKDGQVDWEVCFGSLCPLDPVDPNLAVKSIRSIMVEAGMTSRAVSQLGEVIGSSMMLVQGMLLSVLCAVAFVQSLDVKWLPDITVAIPIAAGFGLLLRFVGFQGVSFGPAANAVFGTLVSSLMNHVLIPISIFEGAFTLRRRDFFSQFPYAILFAVVGTGFSCVLIAVMVKVTGDWGWHPVANWRESVAFAAFIADTDPVATLSVFSSLQVESLLFTLVAGEATMNDPLALVIFGVANRPEKELSLNIGLEVLSAARLLCGSIVLGLFLGLVLTAIFRLFRLHGKGALEACFFLLSAYSAFCLGEVVGMSGIIASLFCGMMMGVYAMKLCEDRHTVLACLGVTARLADLVMFIIIGFGCFLIDEWEGVILGALTIIFCLIARAIMVACLVALVNLTKWLRGCRLISFGTAFMIFHSGLRGGMTMMMALMVNPFWSRNQNTLLVATIVCVIGMAYLCGCTGPFFLRLVGVQTGVAQEDGSLFHSSSRRGRLLCISHEQLSKWLVGPSGSPGCGRNPEVPEIAPSDSSASTIEPEEEA